MIMDFDYFNYNVLILVTCKQSYPDDLYDSFHDIVSEYFGLLT